MNPARGSPEVAVIVGAYSRREYIRAALRSLAAQTLDRDRYEVVVTKNFTDPDLDRELAAANVITLLDSEPRIGRWLRRAVNACHAPIVTFLDDDDEYAPERLERILEVWRQHPDVGFYRNRVSVIDRDGLPVPPARWRAIETDLEFDTLGPVYLAGHDRASLLDLATRRTHATFNTSSMALRRELLDGDLGDAFELTQLEDLFLFLTGALSPVGVYLDDRRLTRFRFYGGNVSRTVRWLHHAEESYRDMVGVAARHGRPDFSAWLARQSTHYGRMYRGALLVDAVAGRRPRREVARRTDEYLRFLGHHPEERALTLDIWAASFYGMSYCLAPPLARRIQAARLTNPRSEPG